MSKADAVYYEVTVETEVTKLKIRSIGDLHCLLI